jgi:hypothetical protein
MEKIEKFANDVKTKVERFAVDRDVNAMVHNDSGELSVEGIIGICIAVFIAAILVPIALRQINDANTTGFSDTDVTLFGLIGTCSLLAIVIGVVKFVKG